MMRKNVFKKFLILGLALILVFSIFGCGEKDEKLTFQTETDMEEFAEGETDYEKGELSNTEMEVETGVSNETEEVSETVESTDMVAIANPVRKVEFDELVELTGITLNVPADASNVVYTVISGENPVAQATFSLDEKEYCFRACATAEFEATNISGLFYEWESVEEIEVSYCAGKAYVVKDICVISWIDIAPGINYNITLEEGAEKENVLALANELFIAVQGDSDAK